MEEDPTAISEPYEARLTACQTVKSNSVASSMQIIGYSLVVCSFEANFSDEWPSRVMWTAGLATAIFGTYKAKKIADELAENQSVLSSMLSESQKAVSDHIYWGSLFLALSQSTKAIGWHLPELAILFPIYRTLKGVTEVTLCARTANSLLEAAELDKSKHHILMRSTEERSPKG